MRRALDSACRPGWHRGTVGACSAILTIVTLVAGPLRNTNAGWPWSAKAAVCGHPGCHADQCVLVDGFAGQWYWMRSPEQELRVVMGLYNRYCVRCHGIDGRGVCPIPDVPDFTDVGWQSSRTDPQVVNILMDGRGAVMPSFRGTLSLEESWAMTRYLRRFVPGTEIPRPESGHPVASPPSEARADPPRAAVPTAAASPPARLPTAIGAAAPAGRN
jgi:hypothetical protein